MISMYEIFLNFWLSFHKKIFFDYDKWNESKLKMQLYSLIL